MSNVIFYILNSYKKQYYNYKSIKYKKQLNKYLKKLKLTCFYFWNPSKKILYSVSFVSKDLKISKNKTICLIMSLPSLIEF